MGAERGKAPGGLSPAPCPPCAPLPASSSRRLTQGEEGAGQVGSKPSLPKADGPSEASCPFHIDYPGWMVNDCFPGLIKLSSSGLLHRGGGAFPTCARAAASDCSPWEGASLWLELGFASRPALALNINPGAWQLCGEDLCDGRLFSLGHLKHGVCQGQPWNRELTSSPRPWMPEKRLAGVFSPVCRYFFLKPAWSLLPLPCSSRSRLQTRLYFQLFLKPSNIWQLDSHCKVACFAERVTSHAIVQSF